MNGLIMSQFRIVVRYHLLHGLLLLVALESQTERNKTLKKTKREDYMYGIAQLEKLFQFRPFL